ncbi:MAG: DNA polymerase III subunit delta [Rikenellaceae bacterium]
MKFSDVIGQDKIKKVFIKNINEGRIAHAQIFQGELGYGMLPLALAYVQYLFCENRSENDSCGVCPSCYKVSQLAHPDLHFSFPINKSKYCDKLSSEGEIISDSLINKWREQINSSSPNGYFSENDWYKTIELSKNAQGNIGKPEANEIIKKLAYKSFLGGYKVVIVWLVERMNESAANTLLKQFEEPSEKTLFIFLTENKDVIIKTILSRAQLTSITPIDINNVNNYVNSVCNDINKAAIIGRICGGNILKINELTEQTEENDDNFILFTNLMRRCFFVDYVSLVAWAEDLSTQNREFLKNFFDYSLRILRDSYMTSIGMGNISNCFGYEKEFIAKFSPYIHYKNIELLTREFEKVQFDISRNGNPKIVLTHFVLAISKLIKRIG